jgi:hypothetical protein
LTRDEALEEVRKLVNEFTGTVLPKLTKVYLQLETNKETDTSYEDDAHMAFYSENL